MPRLKSCKTNYSTHALTCWLAIMAAITVSLDGGGVDNITWVGDVEEHTTGIWMCVCGGGGGGSSVI